MGGVREIAEEPTAPASEQAPAAAPQRAFSLRSAMRFALKVLVTVGAFYLLLTHTVRTESGESVTALRAILDYLPEIQAGVFWRYTLLAAAIKAAGILASMWRWHLLLRGQGIVFRFSRIATTFLIGRFLGTFLPSTIGLDGYKFYDAARFSGRSVEVAAATAIEKCAGIIGIFVSFLVTLPLGYAILGARAGLVVAVTVPLATGIIGLFFLLAFNPRVVASLLARVRLGPGRVGSLLQRLGAAAAAYRDQKLLLLSAVLLSFVVHFFTAVLYYCTALAVGAAHADFWEVTFASTIQIFATVMSPFTIAGEGVREIVQTLLLAHRIGASQSIISAALGFWAAEALTLSGGVFYFLRSADYRPPVVLLPRSSTA
jgi:uncharacterized membrane protein YbhN (UPF0104 family)